MIATASLPMYGLPEVLPDVAALWAAIQRRLERLGVPDLPDALAWPADLHRSWEDPALVLSQTCGYPLVGALSATVDVIGTFAITGVAPEGYYRSRIVVAPEAAGRFEARAWDELTAAVNGTWSLSGWISLLHATSSTPGWPGPHVLTGAHVASLAALQDGSADIASIDAVTFALLHDHRPEAIDGLLVVGEGPLVPGLPLVTAAGSTATVPTLRQAIIEALADPQLGTALARQRIEGFVPLDRAHYAPVAALVTSLGITPPPWP